MNIRFWIMASLAILIFSANSGGYPIYILDEAKNAACAMEMSDSGNLIVPTFNGELRTDKPPLHYYFMMTAYKMFGVNAFAARLFSILMGVLTTLVIYFFGKQLMNEQSAFYAALAFIGSIQMAVQFHFAVPDPYLIAFSTLALLSFCYGYLHSRRVYLDIAYASAALAFLSKGPLAAVIIGLPLFVFIVVRREFSWQTMVKIHLLPGLLVFLALVTPWFVLVGIKTNGAWLQGFFFDHNLGRFTATMEGHKGYPGLAIICFFLALLPTGVFLPQAIIRAWKERKQHPVLMIALLVCATVVGFFSVSRTFLPGYIAPCIPFAALLVGYYIDRWIIEGHIISSQKISLTLIAVISIILPGAAFFALKKELPDSDISVKALLTLLPLAVGSVLAFYALLQKRVIHGIRFLLGGSIISILALFYAAIPTLVDENPVTQFINQKQLTSNTKMAVYQETNAAFVFNLKRTIPVLHSQEEVNIFLAKYPDALLLTRQNYQDELVINGLHTLASQRDLFETSVTVLMSR